MGEPPRRALLRARAARVSFLVGLPQCAYLGRLSYPIYLWHWPLYVLFRWGGLASPAWMAVATVISLALSCFSSHVIEAPFRKGSAKQAGRVIAIALTTSALCAVWLLLLAGPLHGRLYALSHRNASSAYHMPLAPPPMPPGRPSPPAHPPPPPWPPVQPCGGGLREQCGRTLLSGRGWADDPAELSRIPPRTCACQACGGGWNVTHSPTGAVDVSEAGNSGSNALRPCLVAVPPEAQTDLNLQPPSNNGMAYLRDPCNEITRTSAVAGKIQGCLTVTASPQRSSLPTAFLLGDSHAASWVVTLTSALRHRATLAHATVGHGCGFNSYAFMQASGLMPAPMLSRCQTALNDFWAALQAQVRPGDAVLVATAAWKYASIPGGDPFDLAHLREVGALCQARNASLVILGDSPQLLEWGARCTTNASRGSCQRPRADLVATHVSADDAFAALVTEEPGTTFHFKIMDLFCQSQLCGAHIPGTSTMAIADRDHWTFEGALYVAPFFACFLDRNGLLPPAVSQSDCDSEVGSG